MIEYMENGDKKYTCDLCKRKCGVLNGHSYNGGFCKIKIRWTQLMIQTFLVKIICK